MNATHSIRMFVRGACIASIIPAVSVSALAAGPATSPAARPTRSTSALPAALRPVLYRALAGDTGPSYSIAKGGCASLPKQRLKACFDKHGAHFGNADKRLLTLHLTAWGREATLHQTKKVAPVIAGNRVSYAREAITEWWRVLPMGFEQGFTVAKRPAGNGKLTLALTTNGNMNASRHDGTLAWGKLRYGDLVVTDANGKTVPATLGSKGDRILIAVNDAHAVYPLTVDPLVWIEQKVSASDGTAFEYFGVSVAVLGTTALVGEFRGTVNGNTDQGAAYVFTESNGTWSQAQKLTASDGAAEDYFGVSVALSSSTAMIASQATVGGNPYEGAVYIFTNSNGTWSQTQKITPSDGAADEAFGSSVAFAGTTALIGATAATVNGNTNQGATYVFTDSGGTWSQTQKLTVTDGGTNAFFGFPVRLDGSTALIGASGTTVNGNLYEGSAYVFTNSDGTWSQTQELTASDNPVDAYFGDGGDLSGTTAIVGAPGAEVGGNPAQGAAYVFVNSGGTWTQTQKLTASDGRAIDEFGSAVAVSGNTAVIGALEATVGDNVEQGAAYVFNESGGIWSQTQKLIVSDGMAYELLGPVALDGATALIGVDGAEVGGNPDKGAAYFYSASDLDLAASAPQTVGQGQDYVSQAIATNSASAASPAVAVTVAVPAAASFISASASQGSCGESANVVSCSFGAIAGNGGNATANVTLKATGDTGETIENTASVAKATPALTAGAPTTITTASGCPDGYTEYDGTLTAGGVFRSPPYQAPAGQENGILIAPEGFRLYALYASGGSQHTYRIPGNEIHRQAPAGTYRWGVKAGSSGGAYMLCIKHP